MLSNLRERFKPLLRICICGLYSPTRRVRYRHLRKPLTLSSGAGDYRVFKAVARVASNVGVTPYNVDQLFWLIGSGYFYEDPHIGHKTRIGSLKKQFIEITQKELEPSHDAVVSPAT
jgi:hypothetical protein